MISIVFPICSLDGRSLTFALGLYRSDAQELYAIERMCRSFSWKEFYRHAERIQLSSPLADGSLASEYSARALAFLIHIKPFLPQSYGDDDTSEYLIRLMPKALREGGRRIEAELQREGKYHEFMTVI